MIFYPEYDLVESLVCGLRVVLAGKSERINSLLTSTTCYGKKNI